MNLWRIASCSSAPWLGSEDNSNDPPDVKVRVVFGDAIVLMKAWLPNIFPTLQYMVCIFDALFAQ